MSTNYPAKLVFPTADLHGEQRQGVFEFPNGNVQVEMTTVYNYLLEGGGRASAVLSTVKEWFESQTDAELPDGPGKNQQFAISIGAGRHVIEISGNPYEGSDGQWGDQGGSASVSKTDATNGTAVQKQFMLDHYLQRVEIDSENPATLHIGEYSSSGLFSPLSVYPVEPRTSFDPQTQSSSFDMSLTFIETGSIKRAFDGRNQRK